MIPAQPDDAAFRASVAALYPSLLGYARRIAGNTADAEDLVHDTIERGLRRRALFRDGVPGPWMATILRHLFLDGCRRNRRWRTIAPAWRHLHLAETGADVWHDGPDAPPAPSAAEAFTTDDVRRAARTLKPGLRDAFCLFVFERLSTREIARRLSLPGSTVGTRVLRARRKLRQILESGALPTPAARTRRRTPVRALAA
jgi:RNA polymerase sigma-70 factor (ECF subfamily)